MSRGSDRRQERKETIRVLDSIRGHESTIAHTFNHTDGTCPKCGCPEQAMFFCVPGGSDLPALSLCELEGEHLHRVCARCRYPWIERPLDQAILLEQEGSVQVISELAAALAVIVERTGGATLDAPLVSSRRHWMLHFKRDVEARTIVVTVTPPVEQRGKPSSPALEDITPGGAA